MPIQRLNHAVLFVRDVDVSRRFYEEVLGFTVVTSIPSRAAFFQAAGSNNDHDLGLFAMGDDALPSSAGKTSVGLYHLAWEVDTLAELARIEALLKERGALAGASDHSTTKALYAHDPDGIEFEVSWLVPQNLITDDVVAGRASIHRLNLAAEIERYGATTLGGVGISWAQSALTDASNSIHQEVSS